MENEAVSNLPEENGAAGFSAAEETVNAADLYTSEENGANAQPEANEQTDAPVRKQTDERMYTSDDMSKAIQNRLKQERRGAAYQLGRELIDEYMRLTNIKSEAEALAAIREQRIKAKAEQFKNDPQAAFEELLRAREQRAEEPADTPTAEERARTIYNEIVGEMQSGKVPEGFDLSTYISDPERAREFLEWRDKLGIEQACAIAMRISQPTAPTKTEINRSLPKPIGTNNAYNPKPIDFESMTSDQFQAYEKKLKQAVASGKRVLFD